MIRLQEVHDEQRGLLWNIFQKYLYEMTAYYGDVMDEEGNYHYEYFDAYFTEKERKALLICDDEAIAGFAMINTHSYIGEWFDTPPTGGTHQPVCVLAEFTVFPMYRRHHIATEAARQIFKGESPRASRCERGSCLQEYGGKWEVKYNEKNTAAKCLWSKVTSEYNPLTVRLGDDEVVLAFRTMG